MSADADQFAREGAGFFIGLRGLGRGALGAFGGLEDVGFRLLVEHFELDDVAVEFADVGADEGFAFAFLPGKLEGALCLVGKSDGGRQTCAAGSGLKKTALRDSMMGCDVLVCCCVVSSVEV